MKQRKSYGLAACDLRKSWHHMEVSYTMTRAQNNKIMAWCNRHEGKGQYLHVENTNSWYFENDSDAMIFAIIWL